jgi:hypothetical protein
MTVAMTTGGSNMTEGLLTIIDLGITTGLLEDTDE